MRTRPLTLTAAAFAVIIVLTGCGSDVDQLVDPKPTGVTVMAPDEAKHDLWDRLDAAQTVIGGTWNAQDSEVANSCDDSNGFYYSAIRRRVELAPDLDVPTDALKVFWEADDDYTVKPNSFGPTQRQLITRSTKGTSLSYYAEEGKLYIVGEGPCIPGDFATVRRQDAEEYYVNHPEASPATAE